MDTISTEDLKCFKAWPLLESYYQQIPNHTKTK